jgi:hypothetical protein
MRRLLAAVIIGLILLLSVPAAYASDYPPRSSGGPGVLQRKAAPAAESAVVEQRYDGGSLAWTGSDAMRNLFGLAAGLLIPGSVILIVARRRRAAAGG